jgi:hypothetical protein
MSDPSICDNSVGASVAMVKDWRKASDGCDPDPVECPECGTLNYHGLYSPAWVWCTECNYGFLVVWDRRRGDA